MTTGSDPTSPAADQTSGGGTLANVAIKSPAFWAAIAVLLGFGAFVGYMVSASSDKNTARWDHLVYVFGSVEAIAFAAAGALFGTQVQRQQVQQAQQQTQQAQAQAKQSQQAANVAQQQAAANALAAERGRNLAAAVQQAHQQTAGLRGPNRQAEAATLVQHVAGIADRLFPDAQSGDSTDYDAT